MALPISTGEPHGRFPGKTAGLAGPKGGGNKAIEGETVGNTDILPRCPSGRMTDTTELHTAAFETDSVTLTRLEIASIVGAVLILGSLVLPWMSGLVGSASGFEFTWLSPMFVVGALLTLALAIPRPYPRLRYALIALVGVTHAAIGVILLLGMPAGTTGIGVIVFALGGILVAAGGYGPLVRETTTYRATAIVCLGSLLALVVGIVLVQGT